MLKPLQTQFLAEASAVAVRLQLRTQLPAELTLAQGILESGWGSHRPGNNLFGIKAHAGVNTTIMVPTREEFTQVQIDAWNHAHPDRPCLVLYKLANGKFRCQVDDLFAAYPTIQGSYDDHADLLVHKEPYKGYLIAFLADRDMATYVTHVARKYATDSHYAATILQLIAQPEVVAALREARGIHPAT